MASNIPRRGYDMSCLGSLLTAADALDHHQQQPGQRHEQEGNASVRDPVAQPIASVPAVASVIPECGGETNTTLRNYRPSVSPVLSNHCSSPSSSLAHIPVGIAENDKYVRLRMHIIGAKASDIRVSVQRGILVVQGIRTLQCVSYDDDTILSEQQIETQRSLKDGAGGVLKSHRFARRYSVDVDAVDILKFRVKLSASGVLTIVSPKRSPNASMNVSVAVIEEEDDKGKGDEVQLPLRHEASAAVAHAPVGIPPPHAFKRGCHLISPGSSNYEGEQKHKTRLD